MMNTRISLLVAACALALSACGNNTPSTAPEASPMVSPSPTESTPPVESTPPAGPMSAATSGATPGTAPATAPAADGKPAAVVTDCATTFEGTDAMQYSVSSIVVPASCKDFKITLKHTGKLPVTAMGHDVVITRQSDMEAVDADGRAAGPDRGYVKPDDARVIAHTSLIGGGETTSVSFSVSKIQGDGPYVFFCSFPGHSALMKGEISVQ